LNSAAMPALRALLALRVCALNVEIFSETLRTSHSLPPDLQADLAATSRIANMHPAHSGWWDIRGSKIGKCLPRTGNSCAQIVRPFRGKAPLPPAGNPALRSRAA